MGYLVIELLFIRIRFVISFADTLCDDLGKAFLVASVFAVFALHSDGVFQEVAAKSASHDVVEVLRNEFMSVHFMDLFLPLADGSFSVQTYVDETPVLELFD